MKSGLSITLTVILLIAGLSIGVIAGYFLAPPKVEEKLIETQTTKTWEIDMRVYQFGFDPEEIVINQNDTLIINIIESSFEKESEFTEHTFTLPAYDINVALPPIPPNEPVKIEFVANKTSEFAFECAIFCGSRHHQMRGTLKVLAPGEKIEEPTLTTIEEINETLEILVSEETLPQAPTWGGNVGDLMLIVEREAGSIAIINGANHSVLKHIANIGLRPHVVSFSPVDPRWAFMTSRDGWVNKIDLYSLQLVRRIQVGFDTRGIAVSDDGKFVIAGNYVPNTAVILNTTTLEPLMVIKTFGVNSDDEAVESRVAAVLDSPQGYFIIALKEAGQVWIIDYTNPEFPIIATFQDVGRILHDAFLTPDGRYFMIASQTDNWIRVIDLQELTVPEKILTGVKPHPGPGAIWGDLAFSAVVGEGNVTVWNYTSWKVVKYIPTDGPGLFVRSYRFGETGYKYVWVDVFFGQNNATIQVIDVETLEVVKTLKPGLRSLHPEFTYDGDFVYVSVWDENKVVVYDANTFEQVIEITGLQTPTGIFNVGLRAEEPGA